MEIGDWWMISLHYWYIDLFCKEFYMHREFKWCILIFVKCDTREFLVCANFCCKQIFSSIWYFYPKKLIISQEECKLLRADQFGSNTVQFVYMLLPPLHASFAFIYDFIIINIKCWIAEASEESSNTLKNEKVKANEIIYSASQNVCTL